MTRCLLERRRLRRIAALPAGSPERLLAEFEELTRRPHYPGAAIVVESAEGTFGSRLDRGDARA